MSKITCKNCGEEIEVSAALQGQIEAQVLAAEHKKHEAEIAKVKAEAAESAEKQLAGAKELLAQQAEADLELTKKKLEAEAESRQKKAALDQKLHIKSLKEDADSAKEQSEKLLEQVTELTKALREERNVRANVELEAEKKISAEQGKIREQAEKAADERQRLKLAEKDKQLEAARKANDDLQRKLNQGSQQMQGEILELDLEDALCAEFKDDLITPVDKGIRGADIKHIVRTPLGNECGVILWEMKRTKAWTEGWIQKLKDDLRETKANIPVIITEVAPKDLKGEIHFHNGVWIAKPAAALVLATLLRKSLLDVARERAVTKHRGTSADALYTFITSHEFVQQVEAMVEVYMEMITDIVKEKAAFDRVWAKRENQAKKLLGSTANIIGSMQGQLGTGAMPKIKGLELLEAGEDSI
jgi:hypothetical protein